MTQENHKFGYLLPKSPVNIDFRDISFAVRQRKRELKLILNNVSGKFSSGQLTAILGPSGSGKTTLLNILAGYKIQHTSGTILANGLKRDDSKFRKLCRYIMQENYMQPLLTTKEIMMIAANLKLGNHMCKSDKLNMILEILNLLRLSSCADTRTDMLSGGQLKRLFIALELINNPAVIFLDEPTTGLDDVAAYQCIVLLKQIAESGRTVICSIHSPSARLFSVFDNAYFVSSGRCAYQGSGSNLVSFLSHIGIPCPTMFNPSDFVIELCCVRNKDNEDQLVRATDNGRNFYEEETFIPIDKIAQPSGNFEEPSDLKASNWNQFKILILRMWLIQWRNKKYLFTKAISSVLMGLLIGSIYFNMGQDATTVQYSMGFYFLCIIFFMYVPMMPLLIQVPLEMKYLKREFFNKWYNLKPFFSALVLSTIPDQIIFGTLFLAVMYFLTAQPLEFYRIFGFYVICFLTASISESYALIISSTMNATNATFFGPFLLMPFVIITTFGCGESYVKIPLVFKILMQTSFLRYALEAMMVIMLSGRKLECPDTEDFCLFTNLDFLIKVMSVDGVALWLNILVLIAILIFARVTSYFFLKQRLSPNKLFRFIKFVINRSKIV